MGNGGWIPIEVFCERYKVLANTCHKRVTKGEWQRGVHLSTPDGATSFIHEERAWAWLNERGKLAE